MNPMIIMLFVIISAIVSTVFKAISNAKNSDAAPPDPETDENLQRRLRELIREAESQRGDAPRLPTQPNQIDRAPAWARVAQKSDPNSAPAPSRPASRPAADAKTSFQRTPPPASQTAQRSGQSAPARPTPVAAAPPPLPKLQPFQAEPTIARATASPAPTPAAQLAPRAPAPSVARASNRPAPTANAPAFAPRATAPPRVPSLSAGRATHAVHKVSPRGRVKPIRLNPRAMGVLLMLSEVYQPPLALRPMDRLDRL